MGTSAGIVSCESRSAAASDARATEAALRNKKGSRVPPPNPSGLGIAVYRESQRQRLGIKTSRGIGRPSVWPCRVDAPFGGQAERLACWSLPAQAEGDVGFLAARREGGSSLKRHALVHVTAKIVDGLHAGLASAILARWSNPASRRSEAPEAIAISVEPPPSRGCGRSVNADRRRKDERPWRIMPTSSPLLR